LKNQHGKKNNKSLEGYIKELQSKQEELLKSKSTDLDIFIEKMTFERENEIHKIKEDCRNQVDQIKQDYAAKVKSNQSKFTNLTKERDELREEVRKYKAMGDIQELYKQLQNLKKQHFEETMSLK
jgi:ElaB/YqjD/DUF883 family membrane-anchored ribosome-binding protein